MVTSCYGFNVTFNPALPYPSSEAYARLWVHDHLLSPIDTGAGSRAGGHAPLWIPLPPRALDADGLTIEHHGSAPLSSYEFRLEYVCLATSGCGSREITVQWGSFASNQYVPADDTYKPIPTNVLLPDQSPAEVQRRSLAHKLQEGWGASICV